MSSENTCSENEVELQEDCSNNGSSECLEQIFDCLLSPLRTGTSRAEDIQRFQVLPRECTQTGEIKRSPRLLMGGGG